MTTADTRQPRRHRSDLERLTAQAVLEELPTAMSAVDAARHLHVSVEALAMMRNRDTGPAYVKYGRAVRYLPQYIQAWWDRTTVGGRR